MYFVRDGRCMACRTRFLIRIGMETNRYLRCAVFCFVIFIFFTYIWTIKNIHSCNMDYQIKPQFVEAGLKENCPADCSSCPTFPAPFRRIGDSNYCRFAQISFSAGEGVTFPADRMVRILFVMSGSLMMEHGDTVRLVTSKQYVCLARGERFVTTAQDDAHVVVLSLIPPPAT